MTLYIAEQGSPERARRWSSGVFVAIRSLVEMPTGYAVIPEVETLGIPFRQVHHHSHRIVFFVHEESQTVLVARVYHGAMRPLRDFDVVSIRQE